MAESVVIPADQNRVTVPAQTGIGVSAAVISPAKPARVMFRIQNTGTTVIYINLSETLPTGTVYHAALGAGSGANDGGGGVLSMDGWAGPISALSSAAGGTVVLMEVLQPAAWL